MGGLRQWFEQIDADRNGYLDSRELQQALALGNMNFSLQTIAHLMRLHETTQPGRITFAEFEKLHESLLNFQAQFVRFDSDHNGQLSREEFSQALKCAGYQLDEPAFAALFQAYDPDRSNTLTLAEFVAAVLYLNSVTKVFSNFDGNGAGQILLNFNQFLYATSMCR